MYVANFTVSRTQYYWIHLMLNAKPEPVFEAKLRKLCSKLEGPTLSYSNRVTLSSFQELTEIPIFEFVVLCDRGTDGFCSWTLLYKDGIDYSVLFGPLNYPFVIQDRTSIS